MKFLTAITKLLSRHRAAMQEVGLHEANGMLVKVTMQLNRVRTAAEQRELLNAYYTQTLAKLTELDDLGYPQLPLLSEFIAGGEVDIDQVLRYTEQFSNFIGVTGQLETIDFSGIEGSALNDVPTDHPAYPVLANYKEYIAQEYFLEKVKELMDLLEEEGHMDEKLTATEVQEVKGENVLALTAAQKVLALNNLMRWAGIELGDRQGARQQRFIAALTGLPVGTVKEKFPSASVAGKPNHIQNLRALVPLFESINASALVEKLQSDIQFEREERGQ